MTASDRRPTTSQMVAYAAPLLGSHFYYNPMWAILPAIYVKYFGLELTAVAAVVVIIRLFDGITDPTIGYLADRHRAAKGSRKSWVIAGGIGSIISVYFLFLPPVPVTVGYFLFWSLAYFLALTVSDIPHMAWGAELTMHYNHRARVYSVRNIFSTLGYLAFYMLPFLPIYSSTEYTPQVLSDAVYLGATLTLIGMLWMLVYAPAGSTATNAVSKDSPKALLRSLAHNKPLHIYFAGYLCFGLALGMWNGLLFIYLDAFLGLGVYIAAILTVGAIAGGLSTPLWLTLIEKTSKHFTWAIGLGCFCTQMLLMVFLIDQQSPWWWSLVLVMLAFISFACHNVASLSTLADVIDYGQLKFHQNRGSTYISVNNIFYKFGLGVGGGMALAIAGLYGFDAASQTNTDKAIWGLQLGFIYLPMLISVIGIVFILATPITRRRHRVIEKKLARRLSSYSG